MNALCLVFFSMAVPVATAEDVAGSIVIDAKTTTHQLSKFMTGACIEDVNHEIYGGIYSQMVFGESFQEPGPPRVPKGFTAFGGAWNVNGGVIEAAAGDGPRLAPASLRFAEGEVSVELKFNDRGAGNAGIVVGHREPKVGADAFIGYEIALETAGKLVLGRHNHDWRLLESVPCHVPVDRWIELAAKVEGKKLTISVDRKALLTYMLEAPLPGDSGIALRTWRRPAEYRNLTVAAGSMRSTVPVELDPDSAASSGVSAMWRPIRGKSARGAFALESDAPFVGRQSQRVTFLDGSGRVGVENRGLNRWGLAFRGGKTYEGYLWAKAAKPATIVVSIESGKAPVGESQLRVEPGEWRKLEFRLTAPTDVSAGAFAVTLHEPGSVVLGHAFLQPGDWGRFKGLPVRKDVAEGLIDQGVTVLRYGGSMINADTYRWKSMIGPRDKRPPYKGTWYPYSTNGWGIIEFLDLCQAMGVLAVPAFNIDETPADMADFVEYVNGGADTPWGKKRAMAGRPQPYGLKYLELGNEEAVDEVYVKKFEALAKAIWAKDPGMGLVVGDFVYEERITDPFKFAGAPRISTLAAHQKILEFAKLNGKPVWFDVHIWNDNPRDPEKRIEILHELAGHLERLAPGADYRICVFEENANNHEMRRALAHANAIIKLAKLGARVPIVCCANALQCDGQNDNGWNQGLLFLNPKSVWAQPPYHVTKMASRSYLPNVLKSHIESPGGDLDAVALADGSGVNLWVVNTGAKPLKVRIVLEGRDASHAKIVQLTGELSDRNTADDPDSIVPWERETRWDDSTSVLTLPKQSFTTVRLR